MNCIHKLIGLMVVSATVAAATGCITENEHGCCEPPKDKLEWFFEEQGPSWVGSNHWCVVCDAPIADSEVEEWIKASASEDFPNNAHDWLPP